MTRAVQFIKNDQPAAYVRLVSVLSPVLADDALERFSARMKAHVDGDMVLPVEASSTYQTFEGPFACRPGQIRVRRDPTQLIGEDGIILKGCDR